MTRMSGNILDAIFEQDLNIVAREAHGLSAMEQRVLRLFDGMRPVAAVVAASAVGPPDTLEAAVRLARRGFIRPGSPARAAATPVEEPAFSALEEEFFSRNPVVDEAASG